MSPGLVEREAELVAALGVIEDRQERLAALVHQVRAVPPLAVAERCPAHLVPGCVSPVWLVTATEGACVRVRADAAAPLVRALVVTLARLADGAPAAELAAWKPRFLGDLGLERLLTPTRRHALEHFAAALRAAALRPR